MVLEPIIFTDGFCETVADEGIVPIVCRKALDAQIIEQLSDVRVVGVHPARREEFHHFIAHPGDGGDRSFEILGELSRTE
jgi:hypothetical protein